MIDDDALPDRYTERAEAEAHYDRGYYDGSTHLLQQIQSAMADEIKQLRKEQEQSK